PAIQRRLNQKSTPSAQKRRGKAVESGPASAALGLDEGITMRSEEELAPEAAAALALLHARYAADVLKQVRRLVGDDKAADEATVAVFARARVELGTEHRAPASLRSWILAIAHEEAVRRTKQGSSAVAPGPDAGHDRNDREPPDKEEGAAPATAGPPAREQ